MAYHVVGSEMVRACLERLGLRECHLGGYNLHQVTFTDTHSSQNERLSALVFIASPGNHLYLGPASVDELAGQVTSFITRALRSCNSSRSSDALAIVRVSLAPRDPLEYQRGPSHRPTL